MLPANWSSMSFDARCAHATSLHAALCSPNVAALYGATYAATAAERAAVIAELDAIDAAEAS